MKLGKTGRWLITAFGVFLGLLVIWVLAVYQLNPAGAGALNLGFDLRSRLPADYGADAGARQVGVLRFTIIGDVMRELGMAPEEADSYEEGMRVAMQGPVPTATARDFSGSQPFTATPTFTPVPTDTPEQTATPLPTNTPRPTRTPTRTPIPPTRVAVTVAPVDDEPPYAEPGWDFEVTVAGCRADIQIDNLAVVDPAVSSGMAYVQLKYEVPGYATGYTFLDDFTQCSGAFQPDGSWRGCFEAEATFGAIGPGWVSTPNDGADFTVMLYAKLVDVAGHIVYTHLGDVLIPAMCDDEPAPTETATPAS